MRVLKKKFRKIKAPVTTAPSLIRIKIKPKVGRWCDCYEGRLPYPMECQGNKETPIARLFKSGKVTVLHNRTICVTCNRFVDRETWKNREWDKIKDEIAKGEDLRDMSPPGRE